MSGCEQYEALANLVLDEEATLEEIAELNRHLESCPDCRAYYEDIKRIHGALAPQRAVLPEGFSARVMYRVRETAQEPKTPEKEKTITFPHWRRWAALAACCAVAALSLWAVRWTGGVKDAMVTMDSAPRAADARSAAQEPSVQSLEEDFLEDKEVSVNGEALPAQPEEYEDLAKSAAKEGLGEGAYQPPEDAQPAPEEDTVGGSLPEYSRETGVQPDPAPPASNDGERDREDVPPEGDGETSGGDGESSARDEADTPDESAPTDETDPAEQPEPAPLEPEPDPDPEEPADAVVEPVEIVNAPEPGIVIAYGGGAAQSWVESVLGLEWAAGGSYPLSAEQYVQLLALLDEAGEPYRIEPGEGYCLMTE